MTGTIQPMTASETRPNVGEPHDQCTQWCTYDCERWRAAWKRHQAKIAYASQEWCIPISTAERLPAAFVEHAALA